MGLVDTILVLLALFLFAQSLFSLYLMLYTWEHPERLEVSRGPTSFRAPALSFSVLLPARHEEAVIYETIRRVWSADYPTDLLEIVVVCHADDVGTIAEAQRAIRDIGSKRVRVVTFTDLPINKPHGLNVGFQHTSHQVVTIFDAEDDIHPDIFSVINTVMLEEGVGVVQAGVQLMNYRDHWFAAHNCLEYFFWFKSRLHFHARLGMIPLGGNTVFFRRDLLERIGGWDEQCLTEDAEIGLRLSTLGEPIRVVYDAQRVTREETPASVSSFIRQRTRWHQGFLQVLGKGTWLRLPKLSQRILAAYTLSYPLIQALLTLLWPVNIASALWLKLPVPVTMVLFLPLYALGLQLLVTVAGLVLFTRDYRLRLPWYAPVSAALTFLPYQWLLGISAVRGVLRTLRRETAWEKTAHAGAHRQPAPVPPLATPAFDRLLAEASMRLGVERGSVLRLDPTEQVLTIVASRGLPREVVATTRLGLGEGIAGWVAKTGRSVVIDGRSIPPALASRLHQPSLRFSAVLPIKQQDRVIGVLSVASASVIPSDEAVRWLRAFIRRSMAPVPATRVAVAPRHPRDFDFAEMANGD